MRISDWSSDVCSSDLPAEVQMADSPRRMTSPWIAFAAGAVAVVAIVLIVLAWQRAGTAADAARLTLRDAPDLPSVPQIPDAPRQIGRAACRERVGQYV